MTDLRQAALKKLADLGQEIEQAETPPEWPLVKNILDEYGLQAISFVADWKAAQQQAEPVAWNAGVPPMWPQQKKGETFSGAYIAQPEQQAKLVQEPVAWDEPSASFNEWWDSDYDGSANPFEKDSAAYWAWAGWKTAQRQWIGLTPEEILDLFDKNNVYGSKWIEFARTVEAALRSKNT